MSKRQLVGAWLFQSLIGILLVTGCTGNDQNASAEQINKHVEFDVGVDGCMCAEYDYFLVRWDEEDTSFVNVDGVIGVLYLGDNNGVLLCDCREGKDKDLVSVIDEIVPLENQPGLMVKLVRKIYLDGYDVIPSIRALFNKNKESLVFDGASYEVY